MAKKKAKRSHSSVILAGPSQQQADVENSKTPDCLAHRAKGIPVPAYDTAQQLSEALKNDTANYDTSTPILIKQCPELDEKMKDRSVAASHAIYKIKFPAELQASDCTRRSQRPFQCDKKNNVRELLLNMAPGMPLYHTQHEGLANILSMV